MVVHDLHIGRIRAGPPEADTPLVIHPNAVLTLAVASKRFQPVSGRRPEIGQCSRRVNLIELPLCHRGNTLQFAAEFAPEHLFGLPVTKRPDHASMLLPSCI